MLDQSKTWPSLLAQALGATADGRRVWVGNLGRAGFNSRDHLGAMRFVVDQYEPDAIVMLAGGNDMVDRIIQGGAYDPHFVDDEQRYRDWLMSRFVMRPLSAWSGPFYRRTAIWQLAKWVNSLLFGRRQLLMDSEGKWLAEARSYRQQMRDRVDGLPSLDDGLEEYARNLRAISEEARKRPVRLVLLTQPTLWKSDMPPAEDKLLYYGFAPGPSGRQLEWPWWKNSDTILYSPGALRSAMDSYNRRLLKTCSEVQAECFDLASRLPQTTDVLFDDMHYTERGARQFADAVASYLKTTAPFAQ
jgi:lysophospholipase L1-like esterase